MESTTQHITIRKTEKSKIDYVDWNNIKFGKTFTDHMIIMDYRDHKWQTPEIVPFGNLDFHPALLSIHYGQSIFEGMKAFKTVNDEAVLFRPDLNAARFRKSAHRMAMPEIPEELFAFCVNQFVALDRDWIPKGEGCSLYIRPFMFATDAYIGIKISESYRFMVMASPACGGVYIGEPLKVKIEENYTRAAQGGVGNVKVAGNYAASLYPEKLAKKEGFHQLIWTDAKTHEYIEEAGTMNILFIKDGKLITPDENTDTILHGTTKRTVIDIAKDWGMEVEERQVSVAEIIQGLKDGTVTEVFGAGTAATIAPIQKIRFREEDFTLNIGEQAFSKKVFQEINNIKTGKTADRFGWLKKV